MTLICTFFVISRFGWKRLLNIMDCTVKEMGPSWLYTHKRVCVSDVFFFGVQILCWAFLVYWNLWNTRLVVLLVDSVAPGKINQALKRIWIQNNYVFDPGLLCVQALLIAGLFFFPLHDFYLFTACHSSLANWYQKVCFFFFFDN